MRGVRRDPFTGVLRPVEFLRLVHTDLGWITSQTRIGATGDIIHREKTPCPDNFTDYSLAAIETIETPIIKQCSCWLISNEPCNHQRKD